MEQAEPELKSPAAAATSPKPQLLTTSLPIHLHYLQSLRACFHTPDYFNPIPASAEQVLDNVSHSGPRRRLTTKGSNAPQ